jgi:murein DD-endopeptidase MepM/ murein hydrolase activator NlpD
MAHGYLSYQDTRGEVDWLGKTINAIQDYLDKKEQKEKIADAVAAKVIVHDNAQKALPQGQTPLLKGGSEKQIAGTPLQKMIGGTALQKSLPSGAAAVNPEVMGGAISKAGFSGRPLRPDGFASDAIVNIGATNLGVERDLPGDDMFVKRMGPVDSDQGEVVQAIDRLTFVTMSLVQATKEQTNSQKQIAAAQQQQADQLARNAKASAEENFLEKGADFSGNIAYEKSLMAAGTGMIGRRGGGGGPGMGIGGKVMARRMLGAATRRGASRTGTRLGAALGGKMLGGMGKKMGAKLGGKAIGKVAGGAIAKSLGKKIPLVGLGLGAIFAAQRAMQGDFIGAGLELASGAASTVPGIGTAGSVGIDAALAARDMTMMADGGIVDSATNAIIGEEGREGVFPLEGSKGKKTFEMFGEGILSAQKRKKSVFAKIQAEGLKEYYEKQNGWQSFIEGIINVFKKIFGGLTFMGKKLFNWDKEDKDDKDNPEGDDRTVVAAHDDPYEGEVKGETFMPLAAPKTESGNANKNQHFGAPRDGGSRSHDGIDITDAYSLDSDEAAPVVSYMKGKVVKVKSPSTPNGTDGDIEIEHEGGLKTRYYHVTPREGLKRGDEVYGGQHIADLTRYFESGVEQTHLHFEMYKDGKLIDPTEAIDSVSNRISAPLSDDAARLHADNLSKGNTTTDVSDTATGSVRALEDLMGRPKQEGEVKVEGLGTVKRSNIRGSKFETTYLDAEGNEIEKDKFMENLEKFKADNNLSSLSPSETSGGNEILAASADLSTSSTGSTVINNIVNNNGGNNSSGATAGDVPIGSGSESMGLSSYQLRQNGVIT